MFGPPWQSADRLRTGSEGTCCKGELQRHQGSEMHHRPDVSIAAARYAKSAGVLSCAVLYTIVWLGLRESRHVRQKVTIGRKVLHAFVPCLA